MKNTINFNFGKTLEEMESKKLSFCFLNNNLCLIDSNKNLYQLELLKAGSYLDDLIKKGESIKFEYLKKPKQVSIKEIWDTEKVKGFMSYI